MKLLVTNYTFDASAKTVELIDYDGAFNIGGLLLITNVTDNEIIYNFASAAKGAASVANNVVTLVYDTTSMGDTDDLQIFYDDGDSEASFLAEIDGYLSAIAGQLPNSLGQKAMAASLAVVLASDQNDIKVTLDSEAVVLGAGSANVGDVDVASIAAGDNNIGNVDIVTMPNVVIGSGTITAVTAITNALPAGTNNIGDVDVLTLPALPAGTNNIGDVDVLTLPALPAGTNNIGDVDVLTLPALVAGTAIIGKVGIDQTTPGTTNAVVEASGAAIKTAVETIDNFISGSRGLVTEDNSAAIKTAVELIDNAVSGAGFNITQVGGTNIDTNSGNKSAGTQRVVIATDQPNLTTPLNTSSSPATSGGLTTYHLVSAATTNLTNIKASAGQVYGWYIYNSNASARKVAFHNNAGSPTAGASIFFSVVIPPTSGTNIEYSNGIAFSSGIAISTVTGLADSDTTAVALNDLIINIFYK